MDENWRMRALCRGREELFVESTLAGSNVARHICRSHCPVLADCARWSRRWKWAHVVIAGEVWVWAKGGWRVSPRRATPVPSHDCPVCSLERLVSV